MLMRTFVVAPSIAAMLLSADLLAAPIVAAANASPSAPAAAPQAAATEERPLVSVRLERWLADGDKELVIQSFRRHSAEVLPFFDQYLERGLKLAEGKASEEEVMKSYRLGLKFAQLATEALRDPIFAEYAANFASWNESERTRFRAGQAAYKEGAIALRKGDLGTATERFQASRELAEPIGDSWGLEMALCGLTRTAFAQKDWARASDMSTKAMELAGRLHLRDDEIEVILIATEARQNLNLPDGGLGHARLAWSKIQPSDPKELRERAALLLIAALESKNFRDEAAKIRAEAGIGSEQPAGGSSKASDAGAQGGDAKKSGAPTPPSGGGGA